VLRVLNIKRDNRSGAAYEVSVNIGKAIKHRRERADLTRAQLASRVGMPRQSLVILESSESSATLRTLGRVALALDVNVWELVQDAEAYPSTAGAVK
jgi:transcriptional regulator with XRE-family HTH domain